MPQVRFTQHPKLPKDWGDKPYKKDWVGNMTQDEADRWVRRGVAEMVSDNKEIIHGANLAASQSSNEKIKDLQENSQQENIRSAAEAKVKAEAEAKAKAEEEAKVKAEIARHTTAANPTVSGNQSTSTVPGARK